MKRTEDTYSIVLRDHESENLVFIAEIKSERDVRRIEKTLKQLDKEYYKETNERIDIYEELGIRTGLNIYRADILYV